MDNKVYELRVLKADDLFVMLKIINKIGLQEVRECFNSVEVKQALSNSANGKDEAFVSAVGMRIMFDVASLIVAKLPDCKTDLYAFLASLSGMKEKEIAELSMVTFYDILIDVFKKEEFKDFFQRLVGSFK